ncbi:hypothetical protein K7432_000194 [Basidiobolus ranarum]|uniref:Uncharacterized protein n=1 Tax=Basidiobolus ranarum TaxID=34480 RepID=A0ABR2X551_9FUNG
MLAARNLLATIAILVCTVSSVPVEYFNYGGQPCTLQFGLCAHRMQPRIMPMWTVKKSIRFPEMKQSFSTVTRNHNNLNTAMASSKKNINVKYQTGPSALVEGEHTSSAYGKQVGMEEPMGSGMGHIAEGFQDTMMMPGEYSTFAMKPMADHSSEMYKESTDRGTMDMPMTEQTETSFMQPMDHQASKMSDDSTKDRTMEMPMMEYTEEQPSHALLDRVNAHSSQKSHALSKSNQFDQSGVLKQTMYPFVHQEAPQVISPYWGMHHPTRPFKKHRKFGHRSYKIRYVSSGKHY